MSGSKVGFWLKFIKFPNFGANIYRLIIQENKSEMEEPRYCRLKNSESDMKAVAKTFLRLLWLSKILATLWSHT